MLVLEVFLVFLEYGFRFVIPAFSVLLAAYVTVRVFPEIQAQAQIMKAAVDKRFELQSQVMADFNRYYSAYARWREYQNTAIVRGSSKSGSGKLVELSERAATPAELAKDPRYLDFVAKRDAAIDDLLVTFGLCRIYFSDETVKLIEDFGRWEYSKRSEKFDDLSDLDVWRAKRQGIATQLRVESEGVYTDEKVPYTRPSIGVDVLVLLGVRTRGRKPASKG